MVEQSKTSIIKSTLNGLAKSFYVYDGSNRLIELYSAPTDAGNGVPCLKTTYQYVGATTVIEKFKEENSVWSTAYDVV